jgi:hypothetical protein
MNLQELIANPPLLHVHDDKPVTWSVANELLEYVDAHVDHGSRTLETGAGVSTVLFALKGCDHVCAVFQQGDVDRIQDFCRQHKISLARVRFAIGSSEDVLPGLEPRELDLVLIDGGHAFPTPFIDWYYSARQLKVGGRLLVDDIYVWTGYVLRRYLEAEPAWKLDADFAPRWVAFEKLEVTGWQGEYQQPFVLEQTFNLLYPDQLELIREYVPEDQMAALIAAKEQQASPIMDTEHVNEDPGKKSASTTQESGVSPATIRNYLLYARKFAAFFMRRGNGNPKPP